MFTGSLTHYEVLDIPSDASPHEIREAYLRIKLTYTKDSVALYSLVSAEERDEMVKRVEEAYAILSDPEKRRRYDQFHGLLHSGNEPEIPDLPLDVPSTNEAPPMDEHASEDDLLIPPNTDFAPTSASETPAPPAPVSTPPPVSAPVPEAARAPLPTTTPNPPSTPVPAPMTRVKTPGTPPAFISRSSNIGDPRLTSLSLDPTLLDEIEHETDWRGSIFRKMREALGISLEELAETTKISKTYILALEEENYARLPASVYVRGFVIQLAKVLRLPPEKVAPAFMARLKQAQESGESGQKR